MKKQLNILVLFAGAGLSTRGLLNAGHRCTDVEIDPVRSHLSGILNPEAAHIVSDVRDLDQKWIASFDAVWASPPCQGWSDQNHGTADETGMHLLWWSLSLRNRILWVENSISTRHNRDWGKRWNAAQFERTPRQRRRKMVGGRYKSPYIYRQYKPNYIEFDDIACPAVLASELKQGSRSREWGKERRKATRWYWKHYGRVPTVDDMAFRQGFAIPGGWREPVAGYTDTQWKVALSQAIGNGVPVYMAQAFGSVYADIKQRGAVRQLELPI